MGPTFQIAASRMPFWGGVGPALLVTWVSVAEVGVPITGGLPSEFVAALFVAALSCCGGPGYVLGRGKKLAFLTPARSQNEGRRPFLEKGV